MLLARIGSTLLARQYYRTRFIGISYEPTDTILSNYPTNGFMPLSPVRTTTVT
jgi:hypothetical protein